MLMTGCWRGGGRGKHTSRQEEMQTWRVDVCSSTCGGVNVLSESTRWEREKSDCVISERNLSVTSCQRLLDLEQHFHHGGTRYQSHTAGLYTTGA